MKNKLHVQIIETSIFNGFLLEYLFFLSLKARIFFSRIQH